MAKFEMGNLLNIGLLIGLGIIGILIGVTILGSIVVVLYPLIIAQFVNISGLDNFIFTGLFAANGIFPILLAVLVLVSFLAIVIIGVFAGMKYFKGGK